jgi:hypothetical protein
MDEIHCIRCGGRLWPTGEALECAGCAARYSDLLLSESVRDVEGLRVTEISVSAELFLTAEIPQEVSVKAPQGPAGDLTWDAALAQDPELEEAAT